MERVGVGRDGKPNLDPASRRNLAQELVLYAQVLGAGFQAPADALLVLHGPHALRQLLQPGAAPGRRNLVLPGREPNARSGLRGNGAACYGGCVAGVSEEEEEGVGEEEARGKEDGFHG
ncbi:hypothetical protein U1Q18_010002 [Sarracenia purpurea var. burkii]